MSCLRCEKRARLPGYVWCRPCLDRMAKKNGYASWAEIQRRAGKRC